MNEDVELRSWRQFLVLAEQLHFGKAAQRLEMTQPPLTQAIQKLEARLGVELFARTRRSVALTPAGSALVPAVRALLRDSTSLSALARSASAGDVGLVRLGFVSTVAFGALPTWLRSFREQAPGVTLRLREATGDVQLAAFARAELDCGFLLHTPQAPPILPGGFAQLSVGTESLVMAMPRREAKAGDALSLPLVIFPRESAPSLYDAVLGFYQARGVSPHIAQEAIQMQTIVSLVSAGLGVSLVPRSVASFARRGVSYRPLPRGLAKSAPRCETTLVWSQTAAPATLRFVEHVRRALAQRRAPVRRS